VGDEEEVVKGSGRIADCGLLIREGEAPAEPCLASELRLGRSLALPSTRISIRNPQSAIRNPQSAIRNPQSAIRNPQSAISSYRPRRAAARRELAASSLPSIFAVLDRRPAPLRRTVGTAMRRTGYVTNALRMHNSFCCC
jgi:major type 1 subunit fimbrin (pilin)